MNKSLEIFGYIAALAAASFWSITGLLSVWPVREIGVVPFNTLRMFSIAAVLSIWLLVRNQWLWPETDAILALVLSGAIGLSLGDSLLFKSVKILGPRMSGLLFATNAPMSFLLGIFILHESYYWLNVIGVFAVSSGVFIAITSRSKAGNHHWETANGHIGLGILAGFGAALCQSLGTLILFNTMREGQDPIFASMMRLWVAVLFLFISLCFGNISGGFKSYRKLTLKMYSHIFTSGFLGMGLGMSLILWAITVAPLGIVAILSATTPVLILPVLWIITKQRPSALSFIAAAILVTGTSMIFIAA